MALYWPDKKIVLDIADSPGQRPHDSTEGEWTVVHVSHDQMEDRGTYRCVMGHIAELLCDDDAREPGREEKGRAPRESLVTRDAWA
ncbi:MAG: hypothetical protein QM302_02815 [Acidobacteriota bacterium]|nr:hypothetical protein [Acidobacteriota bacterium]